jgi:tetratricopeptide (TPR) repeat protein
VAAFSFEAKVDNEESLVDAMLASLARSALPGDAWEKLHEAAHRDDRLSEVAFAFESVAQGKRLRTAQPAVAAEFLFQAARYFGDVFGDEVGAVAFLERALNLAPNHAGAFAKIDQLLSKAGLPRKLADVYAGAAAHRPRGEQVPLLRRAAVLLAEAGGADDKVMELLQAILRLEPGDEDARARLEALYVRANRFRDVVRLNEQALAIDPPPNDETRRALLARIVDLYADRLQEPERALPHLEQLLLLDPTHENARRVAQKLVVIKGLAGRAAAALASAFEASGTPQEVSRFLTLELDSTRGPKRAALLTRLGRLRSERLGDPAGAFDAFEQALAIDATDDDLRARYVALASSLGRFVDAAKTLGRVLATVKDVAVKVKTSAQLGEMQLRSGDAKRAKATLAGVLSSPEASSDAILVAANALREIYERDKDARSLCEVLERIAVVEPNDERRMRVDEELAELAARLKEMPRAIAAYERLLTTPARSRALEALAPLYEASGDPEKHAWLLEQRAADATDPGRARELLMHAAEVRTRETKDAARAIATCRTIIERFGPARDVLSLAMPLLESQRLWADLAEALAQDAQLAGGREQAEVLARLGTVRMVRLRDVPGALDAFQEALAFDQQERTSRATLEKLASAGEHRLAAGRVLEPVYRREGAAGALLKVLELRGSTAPDLDARLEALREGTSLALGAGPSEAGRALDLLGRGLAEAVAGGRPLQEWLDGLDSMAQAGSGAGADPKRRAGVLGKAIGDREVTSAELSALAKRAAEALAASDDAQGAITLYRRALAFEPHSSELLSRIDDLLRDQGSPRERIALYRAVLARGDTSRRRELMHRIGAIEWHDLNDIVAATATYRAAIEDDADDADAYGALADLYALAERWEDLCELLEARLARAEGEVARSLRARLAEIAATHGYEVRARTQSARLLEDPELAPEHLDAVEHAAERLGDPHLARAVLRRRAEMTQDPREQIAWLDRLGELDETRLGDLESAAAAWKRAAAIAETADDDETARRLYRSVRRVSPGDAEVTARLVALCERAELHAELPELYAALAEHRGEADERADLAMKTAEVLAERLGDAIGASVAASRALQLAPSRADILAKFENLSLAAGDVAGIEATIDAILARWEAVRRESGSMAPGAWSKPIDGEALGQLLLARARALASDSARAEDTARAYRAILDEPRLDKAQHASAQAAFEALIARDPESPRRLADMRWLLEWRTEHAPEEERVGRLLDWAHAEEKTFGDASRALALHRRVLSIDPEHDRSDEALSAVARLALATGETEDALEALRTRRDRAEGPARVAIDLEVAQVLLAKTTRWGEALSALRAVLADAPGEPAARALAMQLLAHQTTRAETISLLEQACEATDDLTAREEILTHLIEAPMPASEARARAAAESEARLRIDDDGEDSVRPKAESRPDPEEVQARQRWYERLSDLQREGGNPEEALATAARAARDLPHVSALWDRAEELARVVSRPDDVAALYTDVLSRALPSELAVGIGERAVQFYEEWFDDPARVVTILERVLELDPTADWAFDRLKLVLDSAERWDDLFALYDRALESASGKKRAALLEDAAQTAKDFADRPDRAIRYLEQLQELKPGDTKLAGSLERLYERQGKHRELVTLLSARLPSLRPDEARRTRTRVAALWLDELGEAASALETIEPLLDRADAPEAQVSSEVWGLLERVLAAAPQAPESRRSSLPPRGDSAPRPKRTRKSEAPASTRGSVRQRAAAWLRDHYAATGRDADLARMLLIELETVRSSKERVRRHLQVAELYEKLGDLSSALEQTGLAVVDAPEDEARRAKLLDLAERTGRLDRLADLLSASAAATQDAALQIALVMQAASLRADRVGDASGGIELYSSILVGVGVPDEAVLAAARELEPLLEAAGRIEERLDVTERIANVERDPQARRDALGRAARLATQLGQHARAVTLWETRVKADERDAEALDGLVDLLDRVGDGERLAQVLALRARASTNVESARADRVRLAKLLADLLRRPEGAIDAWRGIEADFGAADDAALALSALLRQTARWPELAAMLQRRVEGTEDDGTRADLLRQLGDVHRAELGAHELSVGTYAKALEADPRNAGARAGLHVLANEGTHRAAAVRVLLDALRACDDWQGLLELTAHRLLAETSDAGKLAVLLEVAEVSELRAGDASLAFEAMRRAFAIAPGNERVQSEIDRLAAAAAAWPGLIDSYRDAIDGAARDDAALVLTLWHKIGSALESHRDDARGALAAYMHVLAAPGDGARPAGAANLEVGAAAVRVAGKLGEWGVAAGAVVEIARARGTAPIAIVEVLERAADAAGAWDEATRALDDAVSRSDLRGPPARDLLARAAELHRDRRDDASAAEATFQRALEHDATNAPLLAALAELQRRTGGRPLVDTLLRLSRARGGDFALLQEASDVASESVGDRPLARSIAGELLDLARVRWGAAPPEDEAFGESSTEDAPSFARWAIDRLVRLHEQDADPRAVLEVLVAGDALPFPPDVRRDLRRRAARIALDPLGDDDRAIVLYGSLFNDDPHDAEAVDRLAATYAKHGRSRDLLSLRERQIASTGDPAARVELRLEVARLLVGLGEGQDAATALHANLGESPRQEATVEALVALLERDGKNAELRDLLASQAELAGAAGDSARAAELWARVAWLAEHQLNDKEASARYHARVVALEPRAGSFDALARLADARHDHAKAAEWLEKLVAVVSAGAREGRTDAILRLGEALVAAGQPEVAAERLDEWLRADPEATAVRDRLATLYREQSAWPKLARLMAGAAAHAPDKATKMARLLEAARLHADRCGEPDAAIPLLEQASDLAPEDQAVRLSLAEALANARRFEEANAILQAMIDAFGGRRPKERAPVHYQIARLQLSMGNRARALVELDTATRVDPQNPEILRALAELARDDGQLDRAEKSYRALLGVLRRREPSAESGRETSTIARSEVLLELSAIAERHGESDRAKEILESAIEAGGQSDFEQERLESALRGRGDDDTLVRVLESKLGRLGDTAAAARALTELADVLGNRLGRPERALSMRLRAVAMDPRSVAGHEAALALARSVGEVRRYVEEAGALVQPAINGGDPSLACALLARLGGVAERDLGDDRRAAALYERAVELGHRAPDLLRALDGVYGRLGDAQKQARVLSLYVEAQTREGGPSAASDATYRLAALRLASRETLDDGAEMLRGALDVDPQYDRAVEILRRGLALYPDHRPLIDLYERVGRQPGHERALVDALTLRASLPGGDVATVREAVDVAMRIGDTGLAETLLAKFAETGEANASDLAWALGALATFREAAGDLAQAVELKRRAARLAEPDVARRLEFEAASIAAEKLGDLGSAAEIYEALRSSDPADREAWEPLVTVYRRLGDARRLADLLGAVVDYVDDMGERGRLRLERVRTMVDGMGLDDEHAAPLLREIVDEDPSQLEAALMLAAVLERAGDQEELASLLSRQIDAAKDRGDAASIASLALRLGRLLEQRDRSEARSVYYTGLDWEAASRPLLDALLGLLDGEDDANERADVMERRLATEQGPDAETSALGLWQTRLDMGDEAAAERAIEVGYRAYPASQKLREQLETRYRSRNDWAKLAELRVLDASTRQDREGRLVRLLEAAHMWRNELGDFRAAAKAFGLAREVAPDDPSLLYEHVNALVEAGDPAAAAETLGAAIDQPTDDMARRAALLGARASIRASMGEGDGARQDLEAAFAIEPEPYASALGARLDLACEAAASDPAAVREYRLRQAHVLPYAGESERARAILVELVKQDPKDREALETLANLEAALERWDAASATLRRLVGIVEGDAAVDAALRLADACERAGRPGDGRGALERARLAAPQNADVTARLERVYELTGAWRELADLALQDARASGDVAERFSRLLRAGSLLLEHAGDAQAAVDALNEARALRPTDPDCIGLLADAMLTSGRTAEALAMLDQFVGPSKGRRTREFAGLHWRLSRVARATGDAAGEARALVAALECDAQSGQVCSDVAIRAMELGQLDLASRALRAVTLMRTPGPMSKALAYQYMGEIARVQGDPKRALTLVKRALVEDPNLEGAKALVQAIERGG